MDELEPAPSNTGGYQRQDWDPELYGYRSSTPNPDPNEQQDPDQPESESYDPANRAYTETLTPEESVAFKEALFGTKRQSVQLIGGLTASAPADGCMAEAKATLVGSDEDHRGIGLTVLNMQLNQVQNQVRSRVEADSEWAGALSTWSTCFASAGYKNTDGSAYTDPPEASNAAVQKLWPDSTTPNSQERSMAVADQTCQEEADLDKIHAELTSKYQAEASNEPEVVSLLVGSDELIDQAVTNAMNVLTAEGVN